jgi:hypothetical protein
LDDSFGFFDWSAYHIGHNAYLTDLTISTYMDASTGFFDWETYDAD